MYLGAHSVTNPLHTVLDTAALLQAEGYADKVRFRFVGDGPKKPDLIRQAQAAGLDGMVRFEASRTSTMLLPKPMFSSSLCTEAGFIVGG
jgi:hypothetical protein